MSVLFFYTVLQFFLLGRRFHASKLQVFNVVWVCWSTIILALGLKTPPFKVQRTCCLCHGWELIPHILRRDKFVKTLHCGRLEVIDPCWWRPTAGSSCLRTSCPPSLFCLCWRSFLVYQVHSTAPVWTQRCLECLSVRWRCPVVRRWTACVITARLKYKTAWACCGLRLAGLSWG